MYNQSFTVETFQEIFDSENRKGKNVENKFKSDFEESLEVLKEIKETNALIKGENNIQRRILLYERKKEQKKRRDNLIKKTLKQTAINISKKRNIQVFEGKIYGKQSYHLENTIENFFISKKIQQNLSRSYDVKQSNRYTVLSQFINLLEDQFPKYVIRTDIKSFYESIPQKILRDKLNNDYLLNVKSKEFINKVLDSYNSLTGQLNLEEAKGIPRGIGFSPYLSELFMRKIDNRLEKLKDVVYYARYVDDIVIVFIPKKKEVTRDYLDNYRAQIVDVVDNESKGFLKLNTKKNKRLQFTYGVKTHKFK